MPDRSVNQIFDAWAAAEAKAEAAAKKRDDAAVECADALVKIDQLRAELARRTKADIRSKRT